jgi:hypothetical protein
MATTTSNPCVYCGEGASGTHTKAADCIAALKVALHLVRRKLAEARAA